jgi:hypothetical protein
MKEINTLLMDILVGLVDFNFLNGKTLYPGTSYVGKSVNKYFKLLTCLTFL